jgi:hypothetical protein
MALGWNYEVLEVVGKRVKTQRASENCHHYFEVF